jgi:hypothetical protein
MPRPDPQRRSERLFLLFAALLLVCTASGHLHSPDGEVNFRSTRAVATGQGYAIEPLPGGMLTRSGEGGKEYAQYGPLAPVLAAPLYWIGSLLTPVIPPSWLSQQESRLGSTVLFYRADRAWGEDFQGIYPPEHSERTTRIAVSFFNVLVTWTTLYLVLFASRRYFPAGPIQLLLPAVYLLATYAWPHSRPFYTEPLALMFLLAAALVADSLGGGEGKKLWIRALGVGLLSGLSVLARLDSVVALPGIAWIACHRLHLAFTPKSLAWKTLYACGALVVFVLVVSLLPLQNWLRYGAAFASGYEDEPEGIAFNIPFFHSLWIYLLSAGKGIFWYSPPLIAALLAWPAFWKRQRPLAIGFALVVAGFVLVIGRWQNLGGWCWGPRHLFQITPFLLFPLPYLLSGEGKDDRRGVGRPILLATVAWGVIVQFLGVLVDFMWALDRHLRALDPAQHSAAMLSLPFYGPLLHLKVWRADRDPDWFLVDLWRSGQIGAQVFAGAVWFLLLVTTLLLVQSILRSVRTPRAVPEET